MPTLVFILDVVSFMLMNVLDRRICMTISIEGQKKEVSDYADVRVLPKSSHVN
jgi:hypothetical protein